MSSVKIPEYLHKPHHSISVALIGAGGTGSELLTKLGRLAYTLFTVYDRDLKVWAIDPDQVEEPNLGRQLFCAADVGRFKSDVLIERVNRFYGTNWESIGDAFNVEHYLSIHPNIVITCTDTVASRKQVKEILSYNSKYSENSLYFWLDMGNDFNSGNIILSSKHDDLNLPDAFDIFGDIQEKPNQPSCSLAEAIAKQHILVNSFVADLASTLLWDVLTKPEIDYSGMFFNLETMRVVKVPADYYSKSKLKAA